MKNIENNEMLLSLLEDIDDQEGVLICSNELADWEPTAIARAFSTFSFASSPSDGSGQSFYHTESGSTLTYDGVSVKLHIGGNLTEAFDDLLRALYQLGWKAADVYSIHNEVFFNDLTKNIPASVEIQFQLQELPDDGSLSLFADQALSALQLPASDATESATTTQFLNVVKMSEGIEINSSPEEVTNQINFSHTPTEQIADSIETDLPIPSLKAIFIDSPSPVTDAAEPIVVANVNAQPLGNLATVSSTNTDFMPAIKVQEVPPSVTERKTDNTEASQSVYEKLCSAANGDAAFRVGKSFVVIDRSVTDSEMQLFMDLAQSEDLNTSFYSPGHTDSLQWNPFDELDGKNKLDSANLFAEFIGQYSDHEVKEYIRDILIFVKKKTPSVRPDTLLQMLDDISLNDLEHPVHADSEWLAYANKYLIAAKERVWRTLNVPHLTVALPQPGEGFSFKNLRQSPRSEIIIVNSKTVDIKSHNVLAELFISMGSAIGKWPTEVAFDPPQPRSPKKPALSPDTTNLIINLLTELKKQGFSVPN